MSKPTHNLASFRSSDAAPLTLQLMEQIAHLSNRLNLSNYFFGVGGWLGREEGGRRNLAVSLLAVHVLHINRVFAAFFY